MIRPTNSPTVMSAQRSLISTTRTSIRLISSNAKGAMGLVRCPYVLADEPGSWEVTGGTLMHDAIQTAMGKPGSPLKAIYTGTLAPSTGGWWHDPS